MVIGEGIGKKQVEYYINFRSLIPVLLCLLFPESAGSQTLLEIRKDYYAATTDSKQAAKFYAKLSQHNRTDPVILAYFGSAQALKAKYSWNPYNKVSYLVEGRNTLKAAVAKSPENLEIRFLRFCLEYYIPAFLGMSENLEADRKKIVQLIKRKQYGSLDENLLKNLISFLKQSKKCTPDELQILTNSGFDG